MFQIIIMMRIDKEEREFRGQGVSPSGDNILILRARLIELVKKEKQLDEINAVPRGQAVPGKGELGWGGEVLQEGKPESGLIQKKKWRWGRFQMFIRVTHIVSYVK